MSDVSLLPAAAAGAGLLLAAVYGTSGVAKVRDPASTSSAFHELRLPRWLHRVGAPRLLGPAEIALAVALLLLPAPWYWLPAVATLVLGIVYTVLIVRALGFDVPVTCGCFGALGQGAVTRSTVVRNLVLVALGAATVADAATGGSIIGRLLDGPELWWWALVLAAAVAMTWLITGGTGAAGDERGASAHPIGADGVGPAAGGNEAELDYQRLPIPFVQVTGDDGPIRLRELAAQQAQLVLWVSLGCGSCQDALQRAERFAAEFDQVGVLVVTTTPTAVDDPLRPRGATVAYDEDQQLRTMLELRSTPSAVLLGADGLLAGGPVAGGAASLEFIEEVTAQLRGATEPAPPGEPAEAGRSERP
ncbi:MauE/DoxX family redox-associated membrane protein [Kytococcus sedentarius]|uniref:MauE/DoxX family redox-associated membrane protein n=1 Tax=Kytococcus sedentarius TaxID=1276 RepID=UPI00384FEA04